MWSPWSATMGVPWGMAVVAVRAAVTVPQVLQERGTSGVQPGAMPPWRECLEAWQSFARDGKAGWRAV
eukprot:6211647-Heterocapsa_arctica.AAC.1